MRKYFLPLVVLCLLNGVVGAQPEWRQLRPPLYNVESLCSDLTGNVYMSKSNGTDTVWEYDGTHYSTLGSSTPLGQIACDQAGNLYGVDGNTVAKWNGSSWVKLGNGIGVLDNIFQLDFMAIDPVGNIYVAGLSNYDTAAQFASSYLENWYIAEWNGVSWVKSDTITVGGEVYAMCADIKGNVYLAGTFSRSPASNIECYIAMWNGVNWTEPGAGYDTLTAYNDFIYSLYADKQGNVYAGSSNFIDNNIPLAGFSVAKWNGSSWSALGGNIDQVMAICTDDSGYVYAAFYYDGIRKWVGSEWTLLGDSTGGVNIANAICADHKGDIFAGGSFNNYRVNYLAEYTNLPPAHLYVYVSETDANCGSPGTATASAGGGTPPYTYYWNDNKTISPVVQSPHGGNYEVIVIDSFGRLAYNQITINNTCQSFITGVAYDDVNGNCIYDSMDALLPNIIVQVVAANGATCYANTNADGQYSVQVLDTGKCILYASVQSNCAKANICNYPTDTFAIPHIGDIISNVNIAISGSLFDLTLHPGWTSANPGFTKEYWVMPYNLSPYPPFAQDTIVFAYDSNLIYQYSLAPLPVVDSIAHTLTWIINGSGIPYAYWDWNNERFICYFTVPSTLNPSYKLQSDFLIEPLAGDCNPANNHLHFSQPVTGSHDPNSKSVSPSGFINDGDSVFTYTINFQNTGTDSTNFIVVKDTLSPYLDPTSVVNLASSANYSFNVSGTGILTWTFNPLRLPYQSIDSVGSKGFIMFSVKIKDSLPFISPVSNSAIIYFDYNPGITTNTVTDTVCSPLLTTYSYTICAGRKLFFDGRFFDSTGVYSDTSRFEGGCPSIRRLYLTVLPMADTTVVTATICSGDTFSFFGVGEVSGGAYSHTLQNINGCDSIVTVHLVVLGHDSSSLSASICAGDTFPFFGVSETKAGDYIFKEPDSSGCYTVITLHLTVNPLPAPVLTAADSVICPNDSTTIFASGVYTSYLWNTGATTTGLRVDTAGTYYVMVTDSNGCKGVSDSIRIAVHLIAPVGVVHQGDTGVAYGGVSYQWYINDTLIQGANSASIIFCANGMYSVLITDSNGCTTFTPADNPVVTGGLGDCYSGLQQLDESQWLSVYPNPYSTGSLQVEVDYSLIGGALQLYNAQGQVVFKSEIRNPKSEINLPLSSGLYFIEVKGDENVVLRKRFVKL